MRIDIDVTLAIERPSATHARTVVRTALAAVAHRITRVRLRREHRRWVARVALVGGDSFEVEQTTPADDEGALHHFADRIARAVARRLVYGSGGRQ